MQRSRKCCALGKEEEEEEKQNGGGRGKGLRTEFKYLCIKVMYFKKRGDDGQIRELKKKGNIVMRRSGV